MTTMLNHDRVERKQLGDQIDRLDAILDGLADGLNDAVRDATKQAARTAVHEVMIEILSNPETISMLRELIAPAVNPIHQQFVDLAPAPQPVVQKPSFFSRIKQGLTQSKDMVVHAAKSVARNLANGFQTVASKIHSTASAIRQRVVSAYEALQIGWQIKRAILIGLGAGTIAMGVSCISHTAATVLGGVATGASAFGIQMALLLRQKLKAI
jgi:hypothetical protein